MQFSHINISPHVFMFIGIIANMFKIVSVETFNQINYNLQTAFSIVDLYYVYTDRLCRCADHPVCILGFLFKG